MAGGAERVASTLANAWTTEWFSVTVLTWDDGKVAPFYSLQPSIKHEVLGIAHPSKNFIFALLATLNRIGRLRRRICHSTPHLAISFLDRTNITVLLSLIG